MTKGQAKPKAGPAMRRGTDAGGALSAAKDDETAFAEVVGQLDFFRRSVELAEQLKRPGQAVDHTIQTNGLLLDDEWCAFLRQHRFLVGLSVDGPQDLHDVYRVDRKGNGTYALVRRGLDLLRHHRVEFNILCTVNAANQAHARRVYRHFRDELGARYIQFIPIVERTSADTLPLANSGWREALRDKRPLYLQRGDQVSNRSVAPLQFGRFLVDIFEEWSRHDIGRVFVQHFDVTLESWFGRHTLCVHSPVCGNAPAMEFNGDVYSCDHYVEPDFKLGNIHERPLAELLALPAQRAFGMAKLEGLTRQCRECPVRALCHGGCPKDRFARSKDGEAGQNYLCAGYEHFFTHTAPAMRRMVQLLRSGGAPMQIMAEVEEQDRQRGPYAACPCGSGAKLKFCHRARPS